MNVGFDKSAIKNLSLKKGKKSVTAQQFFLLTYSVIEGKMI
jgi:hypothetical protein